MNTMVNDGDDEIGDWSISPPEREFLASFCREVAARRAIEFGPGLSTVALLAGGCSVLSLESDARWGAHAEARFAGDRRVEVRGYDPRLPCDPVGSEAVRFDLALVDGPPGHLYSAYSRLNVCRLAAAHCDLILLHDANRPKEWQTVDRLAREGWSFEVRHRFAVMRRR